jgi:hypothetical protein
MMNNFVTSFVQVVNIVKCYSFPELFFRCRLLALMTIFSLALQIKVRCRVYVHYILNY